MGSSDRASSAPTAALVPAGAEAEVEAGDGTQSTTGASTGAVHTLEAGGVAVGFAASGGGSDSPAVPPGPAAVVREVRETRRGVKRCSPGSAEGMSASKADKRLCQSPVIPTSA